MPPAVCFFQSGKILGLFYEKLTNFYSFKKQTAGGIKSG